MLEAYSTGREFKKNDDIIFDRLFKNGRMISDKAEIALYLNSPGTFMVSFNITATAKESGAIICEMEKNDETNLRAVTAQTAKEGETANLSFLVAITQKPCRNCKGKTTLTFKNVGIPIKTENVKVIVWRL